MKILYTTVFNVSVKHQCFLPKINLVSEKKLNTELAALTLLDKLLPAVEEKQYAIWVFLDYLFVSTHSFVQYFMINWIVIAYVELVSLDFIKANFADKSQYVYYDTFKSSIRRQDSGIIQGSKTGPLFFDTYCSDFARMCPNDESIQYADNTVLVCVGTNLESSLIM